MKTDELNNLSLEDLILAVLHTFKDENGQPMTKPGEHIVIDKETNLIRLVKGDS